MQDFSVEELESQLAAELPGRHLMAALTLLGLPLVGVSGVDVNINTAGPNWLGSIGNV